MVEAVEVTQADEAAAHEAVAAANIVTCDGYYEIDIESVAEIIARHRIASVAAARPIIMEDQWQPIETAPKDGTIIDAWREEFGRETVYWGFRPHECGEAGQYCDSDWHSEKEPGWVCATFGEYVGCVEPFTHWQPLPAPPRTAGSKTDD